MPRLDAALGRVPFGATVRRILPSGGVGRSVAVLAGGTAAAQAVVLLASPVISRLYSPGQLGTAAAALGLVGMILGATCLTYDHAIPLPKEESRASALVILSMGAALVISGLFGLVLLIAGDWILGALHAEGLHHYVILLFSAQLLGGVTLALTGWAIRQRRFPVTATSRVFQSVSMVIGQVAAGFAGAGSLGLVAGDVIGRAVGALRLAIGLNWPRNRPVPTSTLAEVREVGSRYRRFPLLGTWSAILNSVAVEAPLILIVALYGATTGGLFALAQRLIAAPAYLIVLSIGQVFVVEAAEQYRRDPKGLRGLFRRSMWKLTRIATPVIIGIAIPASILVGPIFGERWAHAGLYLAILTPLYIAQVVTSPLGPTLDVLERQDLLLVRTVSQLTLMVGAVVGSYLIGLEPALAIAAVSAAGVISYALYGGLSWYAVRRVS